jgi:pyruvate dehydrogenase E1 component
MYELQENIFYYITAYNENYVMPPMPAKKNLERAIIAGAYLYTSSKPAKQGGKKTVDRGEIHLLASGSIMQQAIAASNLLVARGHAVSIWSVTSYNELYREAEACERHNRLHPFAKSKTPYLEQLFSDKSGVYVAVTDYMKVLPNCIASWMPDNFTILGTDGYGLSEARPALRKYFEISPEYICHAALVGLYRDGKLNTMELKKQLKGLDVDADKLNPMDR